MKRLLLIAVALSFAVAPGCAAFQSAVTPTHTIDAMAAGPLILSVCDQHDESVQRDPDLVQVEKDQALRSTQILRAIVGEAASK